MPRALPSARPRVLVLSASIGAGHDGAARELVRRLDRRGVDARIRDWTDALPGWGRRVLRDLYGPSVHHTPALFDWIFTNLDRRGPVRRATMSLCRRAEAEVLRWSAGVDAVVATYPLAGQTLGALRVDGRLAVPAITFLTDPAAHVMWCHRGVDEHLTVTGATARDGERFGVALRAVGGLCAPGFARPPARATRTRLRAELGLPADAPAVLLASGSLGMGDVDAAVDAVLVHPTARAVVCCGRNDRLRDRLARRDRVVALGWRTDLPDLMAAADVLVQNAGGLSCTEALTAGLPVVTYRPIPGHGRANAAVLARAGLAPCPGTPEDLVVAIDDAARAGRRRRPAPPWWTTGTDASAVVADRVGASPVPAMVG